MADATLRSNRWADPDRLRWSTCANTCEAAGDAHGRRSPARLLTCSWVGRPNSAISQQDGRGHPGTNRTPLAHVNACFNDRHAGQLERRMLQTEARYRVVPV